MLIEDFESIYVIIDRMNEEHLYRCESFDNNNDNKHV